MTSTIQIDWNQIKEYQKVIRELGRLGVKVGREEYDLLLPFERQVEIDYDSNS